MNSVLGSSVVVRNKRTMLISIMFLCFQQGDTQKGEHGEKGEEVCEYYRANSYLFLFQGLPDPKDIQVYFHWIANTFSIFHKSNLFNCLEHLS